MNITVFLVPILLPFIGGILTLFIPKNTRWVREIISLFIFLVTFIAGITIFINTRFTQSIALTLGLPGFNLRFLSTPFSSLLLMAAAFFVLLIALYSVVRTARLVSYINPRYYTYMLWSLTATAITLLTDNLVLLLVVWGAIAVLLYLLIIMGKPGSEKAGYKALVMIAGSDVLMLIGAALVYYISGTMTMSQMRIPLDSGAAIIAFILLMIGALTKSGAVPFHTWIPDSAEYAPVPVLALFPGALDKLLGIYLLARIALDLFILVPNSAMSILLMSLGSLTIIVGAAMALTQKNLLRLLAFSTVSQVGYIVIGIGTALPLGIIGALFHMINNTLYKTTLFLSAGAVESQTKETELSKLGGLARFMPITFLATFIAALAISGIPPLNGFSSKWLIYQSLIQIGNPQYGHGWFFVIFILIAMLGSVLTLAYILKVLYSVFLDRRPDELPAPKEVSWTMYVPMLILAILCIVFGVYAQFPLQYFFAPILGIDIAQGLKAITPYGFWSPGLATMLIILGIIIGVIVYLFSRSRRVKSSEAFIGGEQVSADHKPGTVDAEETTIPGTDFYGSVKDIKLISETYKVADSKFFDIFEQAKRFIRLMTKVGRKIHSGLLQTYIGWLFLGAIAVIAALFALRFK